MTPAPAPPFARNRPHPFLIANRMVRGSYISLQSALAHYGLIPEGTPVVTLIESGANLNLLTLDNLLQLLDTPGAR